MNVPSLAQDMPLNLCAATAVGQVDAPAESVRPR